MPRYCKAYKLEDLRKFSGWADAALEAEKELNDDSIVYIQEDLTVTKNCLDLDNKDDFIFDKVTPEWETFSKEDLSFAVPDWEEESRINREKLKELEEKEKQEKAGQEAGA